MTLPRWTISIDAGGTFTDAIARSSGGEIVEAKVASTPADPSLGLRSAVAALEDQGVKLPDVSLVCHGTTVATNATLTGSLGRAALVTTEGFRDVLGYRQQHRPDVYSLTPRRPAELVPRELRFEIGERLDSAGRVLKPVDRAGLEAIIEQLRAAAPEAIAVSLLFSYLNDAHEREVGEALRAAFPDTPVTLSSELVREFREYPRTATTAINAALRPIVEAYLGRAGSALAASGVGSQLLVMQSNGGCVPASRAGAEAHRLVLSGPAGGVAGLHALAESLGEPNLISLDMGGTSTDVCLLRDASIPFTTVQEVQDHTLLAPTVDIHTIGAGGGSIAWIDQAGSLKVGPMSAKAVPGPASYGRGGVEPTISDAHVVLGTLGSGELAGGLVIDRDLAVTAVGRIAEPLGMAVEEAAEAILAIGLAHMVRAVRKVSVERGLDAREFSLVAFGGAGPLHAGLILRHMALKSAIIPLRPGLFAADGLLVAGLKLDHSQTLLFEAEPARIPGIREWFEEAAQEAAEQLAEDGVDPGRIEYTATVDCRYRGQGFELNIPLSGWGEEELADIPERFHEAHHERYGHSNAAEPVEIVTVRLTSTGVIDRGAEPAVPVAARALPEDAVVAEREVLLPGCGRMRTPVIERGALVAGAEFTGPAIIQQMDATSVILPGQLVRVASTLDLIVTESDRDEESR
ncbi:hydantoinase/oxoprolinase family protein [Leucobacter sp. CSA1]|uniref:Hydantoinase/oxoprolinase family protein n=1 Tax=Leucobacter chromiisoli TaxID=2796471 RepID=A0A934UUH4_9MICO|nr:hydantoinase/oxoprolinase family protein [Leucobacter chromiisoli]MBK0418820.1 hydantoinase/oxoprolinase family protein [Leucobacter chromiisoli]